MPLAIPCSLKLYWRNFMQLQPMLLSQDQHQEQAQDEEQDKPADVLPPRLTPFYTKVFTKQLRQQLLQVLTETTPNSGSNSVEGTPAQLQDEGQPKHFDEAAPYWSGCQVLAANII